MRVGGLHGCNKIASNIPGELGQGRIVMIGNGLERKQRIEFSAIDDGSRGKHLGQGYLGPGQQGVDIEIVPDFRALRHHRGLHAGQIDERGDLESRPLREFLRSNLPEPEPSEER